MIELTRHVLTLMLSKAAELGAKRALCQSGKLKPYISKAQAYREFGNTPINDWIERGLLVPRKDGTNSACWRIDRFEAESLRFATEMLMYF